MVTDQTGLGMELGGGLRYARLASGLTVEGRGRTLLAHAGDIEDWGVSGTIGFAPWLWWSWDVF